MIEHNICSFILDKLYYVLFYCLKLSMNFEANYLSNCREYKPYTLENSSTVRIKTWNDELTQDDMNNKRFKRSQSKTLKLNNNTPFTNQSFQGGSFRVKKNGHSEKPDRANNSYNYQSVKEPNYEVTQVWRQKCLTQPIFFQKTQPIKNTVTCQSPKTTYLDRMSASSHPSEVNTNEVYPLRFITTNFYPKNSQINDKNMTCNYVKIDDFLKRDVSINLQNRCINQTLKGKQADENKNMLNLSDTKYNSLVNLSTESSINANQIKNIKKINIGSQTQCKKTVAMAINTINNKCNTQKIQTEQSMSSIQKLNESMKTKIECLERENKKLKAEIVYANKQKQDLKKQLSLSEKKQPFQKKTNLKTLTCVKSKEKFQIIGDNKEKKSLKDTTLFSLVQNLKQQITVLKQGYGLKKIEQILQNVKRENALLSNQLQAVSLKCRVLEQQNSQYTTVEQQNRRIKLEMRYMRAGMKDYKLEVERLKSQNQKLRDNKMIKKPTNGIEESKVWTNWGSETDSLCLSISIAGE